MKRCPFPFVVKGQTDTTIHTDHKQSCSGETNSCTWCFLEDFLADVSHLFFRAQNPSKDFLQNSRREVNILPPKCQSRDSLALLLGCGCLQSASSQASRMVACGQTTLVGSDVEVSTGQPQTSQNLSLKQANLQLRNWTPTSSYTMPLPNPTRALV